MKGRNELRLNAATMLEALQEYLDNRYTKPIAVRSVELRTEYGESWFVVRVDEVEPPVQVAGIDPQVAVPDGD